MKELKIKIDVEKNKIIMEQVDDPWTDLAYLIETLVILIPLAAQQTEMPIEKVVKYTQDYLTKATMDYESFNTDRTSDE